MARGRRCSLCGEKLDRSLRCTACGLDNTKNDDMYKHLINQNDCEDQPLTHVHEEPKTNPNYGKVRYTYKNKVKKKKPFTLVKLLAVLMCLLPTVISAIVGIVSNFSNGIREEIVWDEDYLYTPSESYANEFYLSPGLHEVGVHIPEGWCEVVLEYGDYVSVEVYEFDGETFWEKEYFSLSEGEGYGLELEEGDFLNVTVDDLLLTSVWLYTDSLDSVETVYVDHAFIYPLSGDMVAGVDFPAGVYDIVFAPVDNEEYGAIDVWMENPTQMDYMWENSFWFETYDNGYTYSEDNIYGYYVNIPFTPGTIVSVGEGLENVYLAPSYEIGQDMNDITWENDTE